MKKRREQLKLTQQEVARKLGCSQTTVTKWETLGYLPQKPADLLKLANILKVSVETLIKWQIKKQMDRAKEVQA